MRFIRKIIDLIKNNIKIKIGICIFLIGTLIFVIISGTIYSKNLNSKNLSLKVSKKKVIQDPVKVNKETDEEKDKKKKLDEIKAKIKELDESHDLNISKGNIDNDITYYEEIYNELLKKDEEKKEDTYNEIEESNSNTEEENTQPNNTQNNPETITPVINPPIVETPVTTQPNSPAPVVDNEEGSGGGDTHIEEPNDHINPPASEPEEEANPKPPVEGGQGSSDQGGSVTP